MRIGRAIRRSTQRFARDERGIITVQNLFLTVACCAIGAVAVDISHFYAARTQLQVAADTGAHAALFTRYHGRTEAQAQDLAAQVASYAVGDHLEPVVTPTEVVFGTWDATTSSFNTLTNSAAMPTAVQVTTNRAGDNPVGSLLFRIVGVDYMDVSAGAIYTADADACSPMQGLFGQDKVWIRSGNNAAPGVCFHSNDVVDTQNNNDLQYTPTDPLQAACQSSTGHATISMPDSSRLGNGTNNECIAEAKQDGTYDLRPFYSPLQGATTDTALLSQVVQAMAHIPAWNWNAIDTTNINIVATTGNNTSLTASTATEGRVHYVDCKGHNLTLSGTWNNTVLLLNDCKVTAANKATVTLSDTVLYNTNTSSNTSFNFGSGPNAAQLAIGNDTDCNGTGAAYLLARGGFDAPAKLTLNNGTIITPGNVQFAAQFGGSDTPSRGLRIVAGGTIDGTSNGTFIPCPQPPVGTQPVLATFRMAR